MAAAAFLLILLLVVAPGEAVGGDDAAELPHLELRGIEDAGRAYASDEPRQGQGITEHLKLARGCGRFAALLAATANASDFFSQRIVAGAGSGITVFCPDDNAVAEFEPTFKTLSVDDQLDVVLFHGAAARYVREQLAAFEMVQLRTLAAEAATTNKCHVLTVRDDGETVWLWPSPPSSCGSGGAARVTKEVTPGDSPFGLAIAVYVVDAVLLPDHLRQLLDGGNEVAACTPSIGYLGWLQCTVPVWGALCMAGAGMMGILSGIFLSYFCGLREDAENQ